MVCVRRLILFLSVLGDTGKWYPPHAGIGH
jgi:hypothetical protein